MSRISEKTKAEFAERVRQELQPSHRVDWQEFLDSFPDDVISELVRANGGWNSDKTFVEVRRIVSYMIEAWQAGQNRIREELQEL